MARSNEMIYNQWEFLSVVISAATFKYLLRMNIPIMYSCILCYFFFSMVIKMKPLFYRYRCKWVPSTKVKPLGLIQNLFFMNVISFAEIWYDYMIHDDSINFHINNNSNNNTTTSTNTISGNEKVVSPPKKIHPAESITSLIDHDKIRNKNCPVLLIGYHSRQTLDLLFFMCRYQTKAVVHDLMCDIPLLGDLVKKIGAISSRAHHYNNHAEMKFINELLTNRNNQPVYLLPGGAYECLKYSYEEGKVLWLNEPGFARCIIKFSHLFPNDLLIVPVYTKNCEKLLYTPSARFHDFVADNARNLTAFIRKGHFYIIPYAFSLLALSFNLLLFPRVCKLDTYFGEPVRLSSLFPNISSSNGSSKHTSWKSPSPSNSSSVSNSNNDNINHKNENKSIDSSNNSNHINSNSKTSGHNLTSDFIHGHSNISASNTGGSDNDDNAYTDTDTDTDTTSNSVSNISSASVSSNSSKNASDTTTGTNNNNSNNNNNNNSKYSDDISTSVNSAITDISSNIRSSSNSNNCNNRNNISNIESNAVQLLTERVRGSLQSLIDNVNLLPERHSTSYLEKNLINNKNHNAIYSVLLQIDYYFKKAIHLFLFTTQNFIFFGFMILFSWLVYFPVSVVVFCSVTREKVEIPQKDRK